MIGVLLSGVLADRFGRKKVIIAFSIALTASWVMLYLAGSFNTLMLSRVVSGLSFGVITSCSYMLASEIALLHWRGALGVCTTLTLNMAWLTSLVLVASLRFDLCILISMGPSLLFLSVAYFLPESPLWYVKLGRTGDAERMLAKIRGPSYPILVELKELLACATAQNDSLTVKQKIKYLTSGPVLKPILTMAILFLFQVKDEVFFGRDTCLWFWATVMRLSHIFRSAAVLNVSVTTASRFLSKAKCPLTSTYCHAWHKHQSPSGISGPPLL